MGRTRTSLARSLLKEVLMKMTIEAVVEACRARSQVRSWLTRCFLAGWMLASGALCAQEPAAGPPATEVGVQESDKQLGCLDESELAVAIARVDEKLSGPARTWFDTQARDRQTEFQRAAQGDPAAMARIADDWMDCYGHGQPMTDSQRDRVLAYLRHSAERGDKRSASKLGLLHARGLIAPQDYGEAYRWYARSDSQLSEKRSTLSADSGLADDQVERVIAYQKAALNLLEQDPALLVTMRERLSLGAIYYSTVIRFEGCSRRAELTANQPELEPSRIQRAIARIADDLSVLPMAGVPCTDARGQPLRWEVPYTFDRPALRSTLRGGGAP